LHYFANMELQRIRQRMSNVWFHQDGAVAHRARQRITFLRGMFPARLILSSGNDSWPCSLDLTPPRNFLWGYLKPVVHVTRPSSTQELKEYITERTGTINGALLQQVIQNFRHQFQQCIKCHESHLECIRHGY
jgi:hypothetical protein